MSHRTITPTRRGHLSPEAGSGSARAQAPTTQSRLLAAEDVSDLLGVSPALVYALVRRGELPAVRVGDRYIRFRAQALEDWIAARESTRPRGTR